jgi:hypothetical protein
MPKPKTTAQLDREIDEALNAKKNLFIGTMATGISYADRSREKHGDYMTIARLPFSTLKLEWSPGRHSQALRDLVAEHAAKIIAREGEEYPVSSSGQTITLGHGKRRTSHLGKALKATGRGSWKKSDYNQPSQRPFAAKKAGYEVLETGNAEARVGPTGHRSGMGDDYEWSIWIGPASSRTIHDASVEPTRAAAKRIAEQKLAALR